MLVTVQIQFINAIAENMGKVIKVIFQNPKEWERKQNIKKLKILIEQYVKGDKAFALKKVKDEQRTKI